MWKSDIGSRKARILVPGYQGELWFHHRTKVTLYPGNKITLFFQCLSMCTYPWYMVPGYEAYLAYPGTSKSKRTKHWNGHVTVSMVTGYQVPGGYPGMYLKTPEGIPCYRFGTHGTGFYVFDGGAAELQPKSWMQRFLRVPFLMLQLSVPQPILHQLQRSPAHSKGPDQGCRMSRAQIDLMQGLLSCSRNRGCNDFFVFPFSCFN
jgi:hypothetical protein